jgi:hypothetical protein
MILNKRKKIEPFGLIDMGRYTRDDYEISVVYPKYIPHSGKVKKGGNTCITFIFDYFCDLKPSNEKRLNTCVMY